MIYLTNSNSKEFQLQFDECGFDVVAMQTDPAFMSTIYLLRNRAHAEIDHAFVDVRRFWAYSLFIILDDLLR